MRDPVDTPRLAIVTSHPIQYYSPLFRELSKLTPLHVFFAHRPTPQEQAGAGFGVAFDWDVDLLAGLEHTFLRNVSRVPSTSRFTGSDTPDVAEVLRKQFDAVLVTGWNLKTYWQTIFAARQQGTPVLVRGDSHLHTPRGTAKRMAKTFVYPLLLKAFDGFAYTGSWNRDYYLNYGCRPEDMFFSPHCVDVDRFRTEATPDARRKERARLGIADDQLVILFAGKLDPAKRPRDVVEAAAIIERKGIHCRVVIAGAGAEEQSLRDRAAAGGVTIDLLGFCNQSRMPSVYAASDVLVLPSEHETWGLVVNEAMASGRPSVISDACGCAADLAVPGGAARVFPVGNVTKMAEVIEGALTLGPTRAEVEEMSRRFSPAAAADGIMAAVRHAVARKRLLVP
ncbi:glycosyltransferase family 4 protein [Alsobacter sp. R-9]